MKLFFRQKNYDIEELLVADLKLEKMAAQKFFFEKYNVTLFKTAKRYLNDHHLAEDALCEIMHRIFQQIKQFEYRGEGSLKAWSLRLCVNHCLMHLRKKQMLVYQEDIIDAEDLDSGDYAHYDYKLILKIIGDLPDGYRTVFNLYVFEEMDHKSIAQILGISENTSKSQLFKARKILQKQLNQVYETERY